MRPRLAHKFCRFDSAIGNDKSRLRIAAAKRAKSIAGKKKKGTKAAKDATKAAKAAIKAAKAATRAATKAASKRTKEKAKKGPAEPGMCILCAICSAY